VVNRDRGGVNQTIVGANTPTNATHCLSTRYVWRIIFPYFHHMNHMLAPEAIKPDYLSMPKYNKILVIDDSELDRFIIESLIKSANLSDNIVHFERGHDAIEYLLSVQNSHSEFPGLILLDLMMPGMTGFEFLIEFITLSEDILEKSNIVVYTSSIDPTDKELAERFPFVRAFLTKPVSKEALEAL
jgi:CheY-like chemotaxis protein